MNKQTNQTIEYFYNRRLNEFCKLEVVNGHYVAWGKPTSLKDLAKLGWRRTSKLKYESVYHDN